MCAPFIGNAGTGGSLRIFDAVLQGHVEAGASLVQAALRELTEETGAVTADGAITVGPGL